MELNKINAPKVSIVTVAFNSAKVLPTALSSIVRQDYPNFEMILVDGKSTDDTVDTAQRYGCKIVDNPWRYAEIGKYLGALASSGEYVVYIDSDNELPSEDWLTLMTRPLIEDRSLAGSFCLYHPQQHDIVDNSLTNTYHSLLGNDPVSWYLCHIEHRQTRRFRIIDLSQGRFPLDLALGNGFLVKRDLITAFKWDDDIYPLQKLVRVGHKFVCIYDTYLIHHHVHSLQSFIRKYITRARFRNMYRKKVTRLRMRPSEMKIRLQLFLLYVLTVVPVCYDVIKLYRRKPSLAWLIHPIACFLETIIYILNNRVKVF